MEKPWQDSILHSKKWLVSSVGPSDVGGREEIPKSAIPMRFSQEPNHIVDGVTRRGAEYASDVDHWCVAQYSANVTTAHLSLE